MLGYIIKFFKALNSNSNPAQTAHAVCLGILLGLMPKDNLLWYLIFIFFLFVRINKGAYFLSLLLFSVLAPLLDTVFDTAGYAFLTIGSFEPVFSRLLEIPFVGFTRFNNTIVAGALLCSLAAYIPIYLLLRLFIRAWRKKIAPAVADSKFAAALRKLPLMKKITAALEEII
ncbi:MAG: TIGR03546 family protein [Treponema sp.]|jgi:uncharacterized protein (TIGR03546 family)|nr:TIGR03546 family protein [Treponema sp.]